MIERALVRVLRMYPRGADDRQLIARLRRAGVVVSPLELIEALKELSEVGEIRRDKCGRWRAIQPIVHAAENPRYEPGLVPKAEPLHAVTCRTFELPPDDSLIDDSLESETAGLPPADRLLSYYAATQRRDPRGAIETYPDRHSEGWQLLQTSERWWEGCELKVSMTQLPPSFRQALMKRSEQSAAIGWPVATFDGGVDGRVIAPALLLSADWRIEADHLIIRPDPVSPAVNPAWSRRAARASGWSHQALLEALLPSGEPEELEHIAERLRYALAKAGGGGLRPASLETELLPDLDGMTNIAGLFLPDSSTFSAATAADLETLSGWGTPEIAETALAPVFAEDQPEPVATHAILSPSDLTDRQLEAADAAASGPLCVIQGPPGTGKSQLILSLIMTLAAEGKSVLFASRNHQALDEVEKRLAEIVGPSPLLTRGRDSSGERDTSFFQALQQIGDQESPQTESDAGDLPQLKERAQLWAERRALRRHANTIHAELSALAERLEILRQAESNHHVDSWWRKLLTRLEQLFKKPQRSTRLEAMTMANVQNQQTLLRAELSDMDVREKEAPDDDAGGHHDALMSAFSQFARNATTPNASARAEAAERIKELQFQGVTKGRELSEADAQRVLASRPVWAVSTQSAPSRIPLVAGLFDFLIIDEASQCDIATALPLFARSKNAVIVGDPQQLGFVPPIGRAAEKALMTSIGLPKEGRAQFAQSINSLFDFVDRRPAARRAFLADQFRSAPGIVDYLNDEFYRSRRLEGRRGDEEFAAPKGFKPGLVWRSVKGVARREGGGPINLAEAEEICRTVQQIAADKDFDGQVGILSPFNAQIALIIRMLNARIPQQVRERLQLKIASIDKFQGGESDVILFSLVANDGSRSGQQFLRGERRRLNVAVSRARALCIVIGDLEYASSTAAPPHIRNLARRATRPVALREGYDSQWERRLHEALKAKGIEAIPQYPVAGRFLDLAVFGPDGQKIDVEVDGKTWHMDPDGRRKVSDLSRDRQLRALGWIVQRFWVHELSENMEACVERIQRVRTGQVGVE